MARPFKVVKGRRQTIVTQDLSIDVEMKITPSVTNLIERIHHMRQQVLINAFDEMAVSLVPAFNAYLQANYSKFWKDQKDEDRPASNYPYGHASEQVTAEMAIDLGGDTVGVKAYHPETTVRVGARSGDFYYGRKLETRGEGGAGGEEVSGIGLLRTAMLAFSDDFRNILDGALYVGREKTEPALSAFENRNKPNVRKR